MGIVVTRPRNDVVGVPPGRLASFSTSHSFPSSNGAIMGSGDDAALIGRVSNRRHRVSVPLERIADHGTSLGIPDCNGAIGGSGDNVRPLGE